MFGTFSLILIKAGNLSRALLCTKAIYGDVVDFKGENY
jgi:hypothetical protein